MKFKLIIFLISLILIINPISSYASWKYISHEEAINKASGIIVGKVTNIVELNDRRYADIKIEKIIKGDFNNDSIRLPFHELKPGEPWESCFITFTYEKDKLYLLFLSRAKEGSWDIYHYPDYVKTEVKSNDDLPVKFVETVVLFNTDQRPQQQFTVLKKALKTDWFELQEYAYKKLSGLNINWKSLEPIFRTALKDDKLPIRIIAATTILKKDKDLLMVNDLIRYAISIIESQKTQKYSLDGYLSMIIISLDKVEPSKSLAIQLNEANKLISQGINNNPHVLTLLMKMYEATNHLPEQSALIRKMGETQNCAALPLLVNILKTCPDTGGSWDGICECDNAFESIGKLTGMNFGEVVWTGSGHAVPPEVRQKIYAFWDNTMVLLASESPFPALTPELKQEIKTLLDELGDDKWKTREAASSRLLEIGWSATDFLKKAVASSRGLEVRERSRVLLETMETSFPSKDLFEHTKRDLKRFADLKNLKGLIAQLQSKNSSERWIALYYLNQHPDKKRREAVNALINTCNDPGWFVRRESLKILNSFNKEDFDNEQTKKVVTNLIENLDAHESGLIQKSMAYPGITLIESSISTPTESSIKLLKKTRGEGKILGSLMTYETRKRIIEEWYQWYDSWRK